MATEAPRLAVIALANVVELDDGRIVEWEALGTGREPLVWVEGGPGLPAHLARADVAPVLDRFRCHLVNAPGSGRSSPPPTADGYDLERVVEHFERWRRAVGLGAVTPMGHSWGALVAAAWAALHPASIRRLILVDGYAGGGSVDPVEAAAERDRAMDRLRSRPWFEAVWASVVADTETPGRPEATHVEGFNRVLPLYFAEPDQPVARAHIERLRREMRVDPAFVDAWTGPRETADYRLLLGRVACPTLVIVGEHDWICGPVWARSLAAAIPGARLEQIERSGHLPQYEAPAAFRAVIDAWLASGA